MMITYDDNHQISCFLCIIYIYTMAENMYYIQYYSGEPCDSGFEIAVPRCSWPGGVVIPHERDPGATYRCSFLAKKSHHRIVIHTPNVPMARGLFNGSYRGTNHTESYSIDPEESMNPSSFANQKEGSLRLVTMSCHWWVCVTPETHHVSSVQNADAPSPK